MSSTETKICDEGGSGLLLPLTQAEQKVDKGARAVIYILFLLYMFMGVGNVADCFMNAVEKIISQKKRKPVKTKTGNRERWVTYLVWNSTVADLTLLALGSSAPEILLSILETSGAGFYSGDLGPSTIVGSAAFNLLIILAVCIVAIPAGETRAIEHTSVYHVTVLFGIFAYLWLLLIVQVISPNVVDIWEALVTFLMFPLLVTISWLANKGKLEFMSLEKKSEEQSGLLAAPVVDREVPAINMRKSQHPRLPANNTNAVIHRRASQTSAGRASQISAEAAPALPAPVPDARRGEEDQATPAGCFNGKEIVADLTDPIALVAPNGVITFRSDYIEVNNEYTDCRQKDGFQLKVDILRCNGSEGRVTFKLETEGISAVPGKDFEPLADEMFTFEPGELSKQVSVNILQQRENEPDDVLQLVLSEVEGGAIFNPHDDGGREYGLLTIAIKNSENPAIGERIIDPDNFKRGLEEWKEQILGSIKLEEPEPEEGKEPPKLGPSDYVFFVLGLPFKVFFSLVCPPPCFAGGYLLFVVALGWIAVVTALISDLASLFGCCADLPDATTAITIVAMGTSLPDTFASMASAAKDDTADSSIVNVTGSNSVNVYLGIGIPWLAAAIYWAAGGPLDEWRKRYSDLPDTLSKYPDGAFVVKAGALGFSVLLFNCVGIVCLVILRVRRLALGGELGGPKRPAWVCSITLVSLWATYIASSIWRNSSEDAEVMIYPCAAIAVLAVIGGVAFEVSGKFRFDPAMAERVEKTDKQDFTKDHGSDVVLNVEDNGKLPKNLEDYKEGLEPKLIGASAEDMIVPNAQEAPMDEQGVGEDSVEPAAEPAPAPSLEVPETPPAPEAEAAPDTPPATEEAASPAKEELQAASPKEEGEKKSPKKSPKKSTVDAASKKAAAKKKSEKVEAKEPKKSKAEPPETPAALAAEPAAEAPAEAPAA